MKHLLLAVVAILALVSVATPASAQERSDASYRNEASFGYSFLRDYGKNGATGMQFDFGHQIANRISVVGEYAMNHFGYWDENYTSIAGGVRYGAMTSAKLRPFVQFMVGMQRDFGVTGLNLQAGAGVNVMLAKQADLKVQVDFPYVKWDGRHYKQFRLAVGVGIPLGGR